MKNKRKLLWCLTFIGFLILCVAFVKANTKLTYLEFKTYNEIADSNICVDSSKTQLVQEFEMPYNILHGVAFNIGTFSRDNNSIWELAVVEKATDTVIYEGEFNASYIQDNSFYLIGLDNDLRVKKGKKYAVIIKGKSVNETSAIAFHTTKTTKIENANLKLNGETLDMNLSFQVYGGDYDWWWTGFVSLLSIFFLIFVLRFDWLIKNGVSIKNDKWLMGQLVAGTVFLLLATFAVTQKFGDELDNMLGGLVIADGGVLYKDYVTQHTPITYYLCAIFALFGANSVEQFRLSYYLFLCIVWFLIYIRHVDFFGRKKMFLLPILEAIFISSIVAPCGSQVLSDGVQGMCAVVLLLEFLRYCKDKKLQWDRCAIISCSVWGCIGAAFVSAYFLIWVVLVVLVLECIDWSKNGVSFTKIVKRYYKLVICAIVPLVIFVVYFASNDALKIAYEQFYIFNREVYPNYSGGLGSNIMEPFIKAVQYYFAIIANNFNAIINATATNVMILQLVIILIATGIVILLLTKKRYAEAIMLFLGMCFSATRDYSFHGIAAWYIAIMIIALYVQYLVEYMPKIGMPIIGIVGIFLISTYVIAVGNNLLYKQAAISDIESEVIMLTEEEDFQDIFMDFGSNGSLYYCYKGRYPVNRAVFMLPWYMDWYEQDNIQDLKEHMPKVVIYNEDAETWGRVHYTRAFAKTLKKNYKRLSSDPESGYRYIVWIRKNQE